MNIKWCFTDQNEMRQNLGNKPASFLTPQSLAPRASDRTSLPPKVLQTPRMGTLTGPMLMHLVKQSSATMCSYSIRMARCRRLVLWKRSYRLRIPEGEKALGTLSNRRGQLSFLDRLCPSPTDRNGSYTVQHLASHFP